jgi:DNA-binding response OmpR family regulator
MQSNKNNNQNQEFQSQYVDQRTYVSKLLYTRCRLYPYDTKRKIEVYTANDPVVALSEFKPNFYDLLLVDINMPHMNGFQLCEKILAIDINVRVCLMSSGEINWEALREMYPTRQEGCFIRKPVTIDYLLKRIRSELD